MNTARSIYKSDDSGTVRFDLPVGAPHRRFEVVVVWQEVEEPGEPHEGETPEDLGWPPGFFERFAGALADDDTLVRPDQPPLDAIAPLDVDERR